MPKNSYFICRVCFLSLILMVSLAIDGQTKRPTTKPAAPTANQQQFDQIVAQANQARETGKLEEAMELYQKALTARPKWSEGWWYLGALLYERDQYANAAKAFKNVAALNSEIGEPVLMLGLCEFRTGDYDNALAHLQQGRKLNVSKDPELKKVTRFHEGLLLVLKSEFEMAQKIFDSLSYENVNHEQFFIAHGLAILRIPSLPAQIDNKHRDYEMIRRAGYAEHLIAQINTSDGKREYERLAADFGKVSGVQYAYGRFLLYNQRDDEAAIQAFQREIENSPFHALANLQIAFIKVKNQEPQDGVKYAEKAVKLNSRLPLGHFILGRLYLEIGEIERAIQELEVSQKMVPDEPKVYFALSRAYSKVGRKADADKARATFVRLNAAAEAAAAQGQVKGEAIEEGEEKKPPPTKQ